MSKFQVIKTLVLILVWLLFFAEGFMMLDPDFGWHLKVGEIIVTQGIPKTDPFSYTMPSYPFVDHEWLSDVFLVKAYPVLGKAGLAVLYALLALLSLIVLTPKKSRWATIPFLLSATIMMGFMGVRHQVISWLLWAVLLKVILDEKLWQRSKFFIPLLFIFWANVHGYFAAGLAVLLLSIILKAIRYKKLVIADLIIFFLSFLVTLINPYGLGLWKEVWNTFSDSSLRSTVQEWTSILYHFNLAYILLLTISLGFILKMRKSIGLVYSGLYLLLLLAGLSSLRNVPLWSLTTIPLLSMSFEKFNQMVASEKVASSRFNIIYRLFIITTIIIVIFQSLSTLKDGAAATEETFYPQKAVIFLNSHPGTGRMFAPYDWGGYLIWKVPEEKVFVDGRMPSWRWSSPNQSEIGYAYKSYRDIVINQADFKPTFNKFNIHTVLWFSPKTTPTQNPLQKLFQQIVTKLNRLFSQNNPPIKDLSTRLEDEGWHKIYQDEVAVIYQQREE